MSGTQKKKVWRDFFPSGYPSSNPKCFIPKSGECGGKRVDLGSATAKVPAGHDMCGGLSLTYRQLADKPPVYRSTDFRSLLNRHIDWDFPSHLLSVIMHTTSANSFSSLFVCLFPQASECCPKRTRGSVVTHSSKFLERDAKRRTTAGKYVFRTISSVSTAKGSRQKRALSDAAYARAL